MAKLPEIGNQNVFKTPENYFNDFQKELETKIVEEKLKEKFGNLNPFSVPDDYFENLDYKISVIKSDKKISTFTLIKPYLSIAACLIIVFGIWQIFFTNFDFDEKYTINEIETQDTVNIYENYVSMDFSGIDSEIMIDYMEEQEKVSDIENFTEEDDFYAEYISENVDYSSILSEL